MAVTIRLQRHGSHNRPFFHIVAADRRKSATGKFLEKISHYDPKVEPTVIEFKADRLQFWYAKGAILSNTVAKLAKVKKVELARAKTPMPKKPAKKK